MFCSKLNQGLTKENQATKLASAEATPIRRIFGNCKRCTRCTRYTRGNRSNRLQQTTACGPLFNETKTLTTQEKRKHSGTHLEEQQRFNPR